MNILWFSWKDIKHPLAGGAETVSNQLMQHLVNDGHKVRLITAGYKNSTSHQFVNGIEIIRVGGRLTVFLKAFWLFRRKFSNWPDIIIDEMNTIPFGCAFYSRKKTVLLTYQLARKVWFYQMPIPISVIGYVLEPVYLFLLSRVYKTVLTESESTRVDLARFGFAKDKIHIIRVGTELSPVDKLSPKKDLDTVLILGAIRPMKQTLDAVKAFELARDSKQSLKLVIAGDNNGNYAKKVISYCEKSRHRSAINILGRVTRAEKIQLIQESAIILVTSIKEGWGLIITEANSQGTPAIAYDTDGLRNSIINNKTGLLTKVRDIEAMAMAINALLSDKAAYQKMRRNAYELSKQFTFENSYLDFTRSLGINIPR